MVEEIEILLPHNGWEPRDDQISLRDYLEDGGRRAVEVAPQRQTPAGQKKPPEGGVRSGLTGEGPKS